MPTPAPVVVTVSQVVPAQPGTVYDLISDVTRMGRWSPETREAAWLDGATGPAVGARFVGRNRIGALRWSTRPEVVAADPGRCFAFTVPGRSGPTWTYTLQAQDGGTRVTESVVQDRPSPWVVRLLQRRAGVTDRAGHLRAGMITTLDRLAWAAVAAEALTTRT